jgi:hypothetical protein
MWDVYEKEEALKISSNLLLVWVEVKYYGISDWDDLVNVVVVVEDEV